MIATLCRSESPDTAYVEGIRLNNGIGGTIGEVEGLRSRNKALRGRPITNGHKSSNTGRRSVNHG